MKAALLVRPGQVIVDEVADPVPGPGDVLIAVGGVGICGSDVSVFRGTWTAPTYPWVMGHEAFGHVEAVGDGVPLERIGERVVIEPNLPCRQCEPCRSGRSSGCAQRQSIGMNRPGALAEKVVLPSAFAWTVGAEAAVDLVCIEPLTVVESALRRLTTPLPESALVVGVGAQGLLMCIALTRRGVQVHAFDLNPERVALATTLGARPAVLDDDSARFELVVDSAGTPLSMATALGHVDAWGTLLVLGLDSRPFEISAAVLVRRQLVLQGSLTYDHPDDFRSVVDLVRRGEVSPGRVATDQYKLADIQQAFESSGSASGKTWIRIGSATS